MITIEGKLNEALENLKQDLIKNYDRLGLRSSGNWENELESYYKQTQSGYKLGILGAGYTDVLQNGRNTNKNQDPKALKAFVGWAGSTFLKQWVKDKGLNINPFAVAYSIARKGVNVPNRYNKGGLVSDVINDESLKVFIDLVKFDQLVTLKSDVKNILTDGNN
jgi:hypothetical protein